jgi:hypothetical protein
MLFSEVYGSYFRVVAAVLSEAVDGTLTETRLEEIVREKAFAESVLSIPAALKEGDWPLLAKDLMTPLRHRPNMPLTTLQKRWMKALLSDKRIQLFDLPVEGLEAVSPLYTQEVIEYFDRYNGGDPYEDEDYMGHFRTILRGLREKRRLFIQSTDHAGVANTFSCIPYKLEYSSKEDRFRLVTISAETIQALPLGRIRSCSLLEHYEERENQLPKPKKEMLVLELIDERKTLERAMLHFSHLEKETVRLPENRYRISLWYNQEDEMELLSRVIAFGPLLRVLCPDHFISLIRERLQRQKKVQSL